jgi:hypothetical protein
MMNRSGETGWAARHGSWEESVLSWHEQIDEAFRRRQARGMVDLDAITPARTPQPRPRSLAEEARL